MKSNIITTNSPLKSLRKRRYNYQIAWKHFAMRFKPNSRRNWRRFSPSDNSTALVWGSFSPRWSSSERKLASFSRRYLFTLNSQPATSKPRSKTECFEKRFRSYIRIPSICKRSIDKENIGECSAMLPSQTAN